MSRTVPAFRAVRTLTRMALRRRINRFAAVLSTGRRKKSASRSGPRRGTGRKSGASTALVVVMGLVFLLNSGLIACAFHLNVSEAVGSRFAGVEETEVAVAAAAALALLAAFVALLFTSLGSGNQDLGQVDWSLEWLFTYPVQARVLFLSKIAEYTFGNFFGWLAFTPFLVVVYWNTGLSFWSIPLAVAATLYLQVLVASVQLAGETWMRKKFSRARLKNIQALCTILGLLSLFTLFWLALSPEGARMLLSVSGAASVLGWAPPAVPALITIDGESAVLALVLCVLFGAVFFLGSVALAQRLVRDGLVTESGAYQGARGRDGAGGIVRPGWFRGVVAKELRLLLRDRNFLVQTLFLPAIIIGFQIVINPDLVRAIESNFNHAAMTAFGVGAYVLIFSAFHILTVEGKALWLLYTFPEPLEKILFRKVFLWSVFASIFPAVVLIWSFANQESLSVHDILNGFMVAAGIFIYSIIAAGIGTLGTDLFEDQVKRRIQPGKVYLFMLLAGLYGWSIYSPGIWSKASLLVLCALLAYAVWQNVRDRAPYLLDPTQSPPPRLVLSDGLTAVLVFFVVQGVGYFYLTLKAGLDQGLSLLIGFAGAGFLAGLFSILILWRRGVPRLLEVVGLVHGAGGGGRPLKTILHAVLWGLAALACGLAYVQALEHLEPLRRLKDFMPHVSRVPVDSKLWFAVLAVAAAPLFEEFLFRGLVYGGLRRTLRPAVAVPACAAVFAVVHPPVSMLPVFLLGVFAAVSFERTRMIYAPVIVHAVYNAGIVLVQT